MAHQRSAPESGWHLHGAAVEVMVAVVLSVIVMVAVAAAGRALVVETEQQRATTTVFPVLEEEFEDLDPSDPLVMCMTFIDHTRCVREPS